MSQSHVHTSATPTVAISSLGYKKPLALVAVAILVWTLFHVSLFAGAMGLFFTVCALAIHHRANQAHSPDIDHDDRIVLKEFDGGTFSKSSEVKKTSAKPFAAHDGGISRKPKQS